MLKKTIEYDDLDDNRVSDTFYFNLTKVELLELDVEYPDGLEKTAIGFAERRDAKGLMNMIKFLIAKSYGRRGADGKKFEKDEEILKEFMQTGAYSELFEELVTDAEKAIAFMRAVVPSQMRNALDNMPASQLTREVVPSPIGTDFAKPVENVQVPSEPATDERVSAQGVPLPPVATSDKPAWFTEGRVPTNEELAGAPLELIREAMARKVAARE